MRSAGLILLAAAVLSSCGADDPIESVFSTLPPPTSNTAEAVTDTTTSAPPTDDEAGESESDAIEPEPEPVAPTTTAPPAIPGPDQALLDSIEIAGQTIGTVEQAIGVAFHPTSGAVLAQRTGLVIDFSDARAGDTVLDLRDDLSMVGESGLLAMTYDPPAEHLYVSFINAANDNRIVAYDVDEAGLPQADTADVILAVANPTSFTTADISPLAPTGSSMSGSATGPETTRTSRTVARLAAQKILESHRNPAVKRATRYPMTTPSSRSTELRGDLGLRAAKPLAVRVRSSDRRLLHGRCRTVRCGRNQLRSAGGQAPTSAGNVSKARSARHDPRRPRPAALLLQP